MYIKYGKLTSAIFDNIMGCNIIQIEAVFIYN